MDLLDVKRILHSKFKNRYRLVSGQKTNMATDPIKLICPVHGEFYTNYVSLCKYDVGCKKCGIEEKKKSKLTIETFIKEAKKIHGDKFIYDQTECVDGRTFVTIKCKKHGYFKQSPVAHLAGHNGCKGCKTDNMVEERRDYVTLWKERACNVHKNKYDYSKMVYKNNYTKVCIICPKHGEFWQTPNSHLDGNGCPDCKYDNDKKPAAIFLDQLYSKYKNDFKYDKVEYKGAFQKVNLVCPKHGDLFVSPAHLMLVDNYYRCPKCITDTKQRNFIQMAKRVHGDKYDYSKSVYTKYRERLCIICPKHGEFWQTPNNHLAGSGCKYCSASKGEELLRNYLSDNGIEYVTEYRLGEHKYRYDFYLPKFNLLIEYHGEQHYRESWFTQEGHKKSAYMSFETRKDMDYLKMLLAKKRGYYYLVISHKQNSIGVFKAFINKTFKYKYQDKYYKSTNEIMKLLEDKTISAHDIHNKYKLSNPILN